MLNTSIGLDLGTSTVVVYVKGKGIVLNEPSAIAIKKDTNETIATGHAAQIMYGRTPSDTEVIHPLQAGVISSYTYTDEMIKHMLSGIIKNFFSKPKIVICVPSGITDVEQRAVIETARQIGARDIYVIEEPIAAALGAGLNINSPVGCMVADIGGGTTDIGIISSGKIISGSSIKIAGNDFNDAIARYIRKKYNIIIGPQTAEHLKKSIGSATSHTRDLSSIARGICTVSGLPKAEIVTSQELTPCFDEIIHNISERCKDIMEEVSPQLQGDILKSGIMLTGGGSLLNGLSERLSEETGVEVHLAPTPVSCVAKGAGMALDRLNDNSNFRFFKKAYIHE